MNIHSCNYYIKISFIEFAVAQVERNLVKAVTEDIKIPNYSKVTGDSWHKESDHALIPNETLKDAKGVWLFSCCQLFVVISV